MCDLKTTQAFKGKGKFTTGSSQKHMDKLTTREPLGKSLRDDATSKQKAQQCFSISCLPGQCYTQSLLHLLPPSPGASNTERTCANYSQITAEAAHRSHPAPQAILCCLDRGGGKGKRERKMKLTVRFYSHLTLIHQQTKSIRLDRVQKPQRRRGCMSLQESTAQEELSRGYQRQRSAAVVREKPGSHPTRILIQGHVSPSLFWSRIASTSLQYSLLASKGIFACW